MDRRTDSPCVLQDFVPFGAAALLPLNLNHILLKQGTGTADHLLPLGCYSCLCFCTLTFVCILFPLSYTSCVNKWHEYISNITPISHHIRVLIDWNRKDGRHSWDGKRENMSNWADTCAYSRANTRGQRRKSCPKMIEVGQNLKAKSKGKIYKQNLQKKFTGKMCRKNVQEKSTYQRTGKHTPSLTRVLKTAESSITYISNWLKVVYMYLTAV